jgi:signal transduction histidine kinase
MGLQPAVSLNRFFCSSAIRQYGFPTEQGIIHPLKRPFRMEIEKIYRGYTFSLIVLCYALIAVLLWLVRSEWNEQGLWVEQIYVLAAVSFMLSAALFVFRRYSYSRIIFIVKVIILLLFTNIVFVLGSGLGQGWGLEIAFMFILIVEISGFFALRPSVVLTFSIVGVTILNILITMRVDASFPRIPASDVLALAAIAAVVGIAANTVRGVVRSLDLQVRTNDRMEKAISQLIDANIGFQNFATAAGQESAHQERTRLSQDIHDTAMHSLINIIMLAESIVDKTSPDQSEVSGMLEMIISQAKDAVKDTRQSLRELRNKEDESPRGPRAIHELISVFSKTTGVEVGINYGNLFWRFGVEIDEVMYRMVQEGLTNAFRHGKATRIQINLWIVRGDMLPEINISIYDNGQGSSEIKKGIGLQGMEERIQRLKGSFEARSQPDGFHINASIPFIDAEDGD